MAMMFKDRREAGRRLAGTLRPFVALPDLLVLGLPRGGIPVAYEGARARDAPLAVLVVRRRGVRGRAARALASRATGAGTLRCRATLRQPRAHPAPCGLPETPGAPRPCVTTHESTRRHERNSRDPLHRAHGRGIRNDRRATVDGEKHVDGPRGDRQCGDHRSERRAQTFGGARGGHDDDDRARDLQEEKRIDQCRLPLSVSGRSAPGCCPRPKPPYPPP